MAGTEAVSVQPDAENAHESHQKDQRVEKQEQKPEAVVDDAFFHSLHGFDGWQGERALLKQELFVTLVLAISVLNGEGREQIKHV